MELVNRADKLFKCPFCTMPFKLKWGLQKHSEIKHDTEIEVEVESDIDMGTEIIPVFYENILKKNQTALGFEFQISKGFNYLSTFMYHSINVL